MDVDPPFWTMFSWIARTSEGRRFLIGRCPSMGITNLFMAVRSVANVLGRTVVSLIFSHCSAHCFTVVLSVGFRLPLAYSVLVSASLFITPARVLAVTVIRCLLPVVVYPASKVAAHRPFFLWCTEPVPYGLLVILFFGFVFIQKPYL